MTPDFSIFGETPSAPIAIIATPGAEELAQLIDKRLINLFSESHLGKKLLSNENYVNKAPKTIVDAERESLEKEMAKLEILKQSL